MPATAFGRCRSFGSSSRMASDVTLSGGLKVGDEAGKCS